LVRLAASNGWTKQPRREAATTTGTIIHTANVTNKEYYEVGWAHITKAPWTISAPQRHFAIVVPVRVAMLKLRGSEVER
jgi:hypothetical protein